MGRARRLIAPGTNTRHVTRASLDVNDLLRIVLALVIAWLVIEVLTEVLGFAVWFLRALPSLLAVAVVVILVLWFTDRI